MKRHSIAIVAIIVTLMTTTISAEVLYVGIDPEDFKQHYYPQEQFMWCWASSLEMVLSHQDIKLKQYEIVNRIKGAPINQPGNLLEVMSVANGFYKDTRRRPCIVSGQVVLGAPVPTVLYNHLKQGNPIILSYQGTGMVGHAVVLVGATVDYRPNSPGNELRILKLHVFDPFPYQQISTPTGPIFQFNEALIQKTYHPRPMRYGPAPWQVGIGIEPGIITSVTLVEGTR